MKLECEPAPLLLGFVLGPMMEENLRRALLLSRGDWTVFVTRPISAVMLGIAAVLLLIIVAPSIRKKREEAFHEVLTRVAPHVPCAAAAVATRRIAREPARARR